MGPSVSWEELAGAAVLEGSCSLVLIMGKCQMEKVFLDNNQIADLSPAVPNGTFVQRNISPGKHRLNIRHEHLFKAFGDISDSSSSKNAIQATSTGSRYGIVVNDPTFETVFECESGETVYAELDSVPVRAGCWPRLDGVITTSNHPTWNVVEMGALHPILWQRGTWYGPSTNPSVGSQ